MKPLDKREVRLDELDFKTNRKRIDSTLNILIYLSVRLQSWDLDKKKTSDLSFTTFYMTM